ncbi:MAG TPA: hypothetical protein VMB25_24825 [Bryobacteraceae bacterium]|nr:hypothetical protein [Bryobacteraceae bacterium]
MRFLAAGLLLAASAFAQTPTFMVQDLGSLNNSSQTPLPDCSATAISQSGNVVGWCAPTPNYTLIGNMGAGSPSVDAFLYINGGIQDLNLTSSMFPTPIPTAVNDSGIVAGAYLNIDLETGTSDTPFVVESDGSSQILEGTVQALLPFSLNNAGQIAGTRLQMSSGFNFFRYSQALLTTLSGGKPTILSPVSGILGTPTAAAFGMSPAGTWVAGASIGPGATSIQATLWQGQTPQGLQALANYSQSIATAVNDSGMAAGIAFDMNLDTDMSGAVSGADAHAVVFTIGIKPSVTDLGTLSGDKSSMALGINNSGWVVGYSNRQAPPLGLNLAPLLTYATANDRAFLAINGVMYDLNQLTSNLGAWQLCYAVGVNNAGQIVGTGLLDGQQRAFLLTPAVATPPPQINSAVGAANSVPPVTSISTNSLFTLYGTSFAPQSVSHAVTQQDLLNNGTTLPTNLASTCVESNGTPWPLLYVSATQINALAPNIPASGTVPLTVVANCGTGNDVTSATYNATVAAAAPEFLYFVDNVNGQDPVAAIENATGAYVGTPNLLPGSTFAPAHPGDVLAAFGVGWGATNSTDPIGTLATAAASVIGNYSLTVGGQDAKVLYAGLTPGFAGLYQVDFVVPSLPSGSGPGPFNQALVLTVNGVTTPTGGYITVEQ